jgi:hypothetical protein
MVHDLMVFCPNGAQGDSPGQRPGFDGPESFQALKGRNLSERQPIRLPYPGRRFALPWAISFCPFGAVGFRWLIQRPQGSFATTGRGMIIHRPRSSGLLPQRGAR